MNKPADDHDAMHDEYDFSGKTPVQGKYYHRMREGYSINIHNDDGTTTIQKIVRPEGTIMLDPDVREYFPDAESVNNALRSLIRLIPPRR